MRVNVSFSDLRSEPTVHSGMMKDPLQNSQLLYNEHVKVIDVFNEWSYVEAIEQPYYDHDLGWTGYKGWTKSEHLTASKSDKKKDVVVTSKWASFVNSDNQSLLAPFGSCFHLESIDIDGLAEILLPDNSRGMIASQHLTSLKSTKNDLNFFQLTSYKFLNDPYFWGGRCPKIHNESLTKTSVDCSGLVNLIYRAKGICLPRNACDQYRASKKIKLSDLQEGDLIFSAPKTCPHNIDHVMLYLGNDQIIEATISVGCVRKISTEKRFGFRLESYNESLSSTVALYFGRPIHTLL